MKRKAAEENFKTIYLAKDFHVVYREPQNSTILHSIHRIMAQEALPDLLPRETIITCKITRKKILWRKHLFKKNLLHSVRTARVCEMNHIPLPSCLSQLSLTEVPFYLVLMKGNRFLEKEYGEKGDIDEVTTVAENSMGSLEN